MPDKLALIGCSVVEHALRCLPPGDACRVIIEEDIRTIRSGRDPRQRLRDSQRSRDRRIYNTGQGELLLAGKDLLKLAELGSRKMFELCTRCWNAVELMNGYQAGRYESHWQEFAIHPLIDRVVSDDEIAAAVNIITKFRIEQVGREFNVHVGESPHIVAVFASREKAEEYIRNASEETYLDVMLPAHK